MVTAVSVKIGTNISGIRALNEMARGASALAQVFERLSSGQRIDNPSVDPAGLSLSSNLKCEQRVYTQAVRNLNDGVSLMNIADGAIEQLSVIVTRMQELSAQAANGTYGLSQRKALDAEAQALSNEYSRIIHSTEINGRRPLQGDFGQLMLQAGFGANGRLISSLGGAVGDGTFAGASSYTAETGASHGLAVADLNNDGILDMVTCGRSDGWVGYATVRLGQGDGTFGAATSYLAESDGSASVALGDLNGDGILDLVTAGATSTSDGSATVRLGRGDGTFGDAASYATETAKSWEVSLSDVNNDGVLDIVTAGLQDGGAGYATIRIGRGDGTFGTAVSYATESGGSNGLYLGDVNNDGKVDLVTSGTTGAAGYATIRLGQGDGSFGSATSYQAESLNSYAVHVADLNGDGNLDLITSGTTGAAGYATVRMGLGNGTFGAAISYTAETRNSLYLTIGDLNGDGYLDLVTAGESTAGAGYATVRLGTGNGTFGAATSYATEGYQSYGAALKDLNRDGVVDLITTGQTPGGVDGYATVRLSNTTNGVSPLLPFKLTSRAEALQALSVFKQTLERLGAQRGVIGAFQSRVATATETLWAISESSASAYSRITDADIASETANMTRLMIQQQAAQAVFTQANQTMALVVKLLD